jgi:dTDP-4-dehydrorhamnose 3,5-epimerase
VFRLRRFEDARGDFAEVFRRSWDTGTDPVQWSLVGSRAGTLRGVHLHPVHVDYLTILAGTATVGLCDLRPDSPTHGLACAVPLDGARPSSIVIPNGVAHGFLFHSDAMSLYAVSHTWDPDDEVEMRWDDPLLAIPWDAEPKTVSERDLGARPVAETLGRLGWPLPAR